LNRLSLSGPYEAKDAVRDCIGVIANQEGRNDLAPSSQYLYKWEQRSDIPDEYRRLAQELKFDFGNRATELQRLKDEQAALRVDKILSENRDLVDKFLEIAERKVSVLDDYGDEQWDSLPGEIAKVLKKINEREGLADYWELKPTKGEDWAHSVSSMSRLLPQEYRSLPEKLLQLFLEHHERAKSKPATEFDVQSLSGVEFETYISRLLRSAGYEVQGTPTTGDQGADLIAKKDGRTVIIQAKRYQGAVGNKAVQEVISAISFYGGNEGWVVTNSTFTPSAIALAQKANVKLIDGATLKSKSVL
jgi:restriction endonuclease Mrr